MLKRIILRNSISSLCQQSFCDFEKTFGLRRVNYSITFFKMVIIKLNYVSLGLDCFNLSKLKNINVQLKCNYGNNLPKAEKSAIAEQKVENWGGQEAFNTIIFIKENYKEVIQANSSILVFFSAEWCTHCKKLKEVYGKASLMALKANLPIKFAFFDVNIKPEIAEENGVVGVPTIKYYKEGKFISNFKGKRTVDDLYKFAENPPTQFVESSEADF